MKLTKTEKTLRDEIAKELYIRKAPNRLFEELHETVMGSFDAAEEFVKIRRDIHEREEIDLSAYKGTLESPKNENWDGTP